VVSKNVREKTIVLQGGPGGRGTYENGESNLDRGPGNDRRLRGARVRVAAGWIWPNGVAFGRPPGAAGSWSL